MFRTLILLCLSAAALAALPKGWNACSKSDSKYSECLNKEIVNAIRSLVNGNKKLGVMPIDPLKIEKLSIGKGSGPVALELLLTKLNVYGIKELSIKNLKNDWKTMQFEVFIPKLIVLSQYKVDGKVLILPITGNGKANLTFDQLTIKGDIKWKDVQKGNAKYFNMETLRVPLEPKRLYIKLENLFNGDKALGENMNIFINENWEQILNELRKPISDALSVAFLQISDTILNKIPSNEINIK